jgi:hypothetical protein
VPRAYVDQIYNRARMVAVGDAKSLANRRGEVLDRLQKLGVSADRVFAKLEVKGIEDIGLEHLEVLIGFGTAIKSGEMELDAAFPAPAPAPAPPDKDGKRISMGKKVKNEPEPPHDPETGEMPPSDDPPPFG